jgi:hypothetical protein
MSAISRYELARAIEEAGLLPRDDLPEMMEVGSQEWVDFWGRAGISWESDTSMLVLSNDNPWAITVFTFGERAAAFGFAVLGENPTPELAESCNREVGARMRRSFKTIIPNARMSEATGEIARGMIDDGEAEAITGGAPPIAMGVMQVEAQDDGTLEGKEFHAGTLSPAIAVAWPPSKGGSQ